jgi:hypothetical protein
MSLEDWAQIATIIGALVAIAVLGYTGYQVRANTLISRGQFWLELRKMFAEHDEVHRKLRPGGAWYKSSTDPSKPGDMAEAEAYMGLFEHCEIMLAENLIDENTFKDIYAYRLDNIVNNHRIRQEKLHVRGDKWKKFISLLKRFDKQGLLQQHGGAKGRGDQSPATNG